MTDEGIVVRGHGKSFVVRALGTEIICEIRGKVKRAVKGISPVAVGDHVIISRNQDGSGIIDKVEKRRTMFFRPAKGSDSKRQVIAANIDKLAIVVSVTQPALKTGLIDRFLIAAEIGNLKPMLIINKIDLEQPASIDKIVAAYSKIDIDVFCVSAVTGKSIDLLAKALIDFKTVFAGHSGVGKTTILNLLLPGKNLKVAQVSDYSNKGVHTTSVVELFELPGGGYVLDSPGLKVLGLWEVKKNQLAEYFKEMRQYHGMCRFSGCSHTHEPDCVVKEAVNSGEIAGFRYRNYLAIYDSLEN